MCVCVCVCVCARVCVRACVRVCDQRECGKKCEKRKGKETFVGISNEQSLSICAWVCMATVLAYERVTHHGIYLEREAERERETERERQRERHGRRERQSLYGI